MRGGYFPSVTIMGCVVSQLKPPVLVNVNEERLQGHTTRKKLYSQIEKMLGIPIVSYFTSFHAPVVIDDSDVKMMEDVLQKTDVRGGFALMISSPGGSGLAAERLVNLCRAYSGNDGYWAIVPGKAKSAATMICLGAHKILMGPSSELGPVDPQVVETDDDGTSQKVYAAHNLVESYQSLFNRATRTKGNLQPYLQQLAHYDERDIQEYRTAIDLAEDIAVRSLRTGMMSDKTESAIRKKIELFLSPKKTKAHGRPICRDEADRCGLTVEPMDAKSDLWSLIYELYFRLDSLVSSDYVKMIETGKHSVAAQGPRRG